ncbi:hypothetical protein SEMRO_1382_G267940.1 [Seminavis robusta]|uniref:Uncharacterized protein n=1 Tax=Seminavis robusta TaxID=568900 RepID=A0A9N8EL96_9STRA|nr:hypothetical protein SEMRO_1382_G267940.1 [Seminavis robusta]|eukprot:Sro1382_g267940.1 n/a (165) ;mRNA; r:26232-26818
MVYAALVCRSSLPAKTIKKADGTYRPLCNLLSPFLNQTGTDQIAEVNNKARAKSFRRDAEQTLKRKAEDERYSLYRRNRQSPRFRDDSDAAAENADEWREHARAQVTSNIKAAVATIKTGGPILNLDVVAPVAWPVPVVVPAAPAAAAAPAAGAEDESSDEGEE